GRTSSLVSFVPFVVDQPCSRSCIRESPLKRIAILGSTGSIGRNALAVVDAHPDRLQVVGLAAGENAELLAAQIAQYEPRVAAMCLISVCRGAHRRRCGDSC